MLSVSCTYLRISSAQGDLITSHGPGQPSPGDVSATSPMELDVGPAGLSFIQCLFPGDSFVIDPFIARANNLDINSDIRAQNSATFETEAYLDGALDVSMLALIASDQDGWANDIPEPKELDSERFHTEDGAKNAIEIGVETEKPYWEDSVDGLDTNAATTSEISEILYTEAGSEDLETYWPEYINDPDAVEGSGIENCPTEHLLRQQQEQDPNRQSGNPQSIAVIDLIGDDTDIEEDHNLLAQSAKNRQSVRRRSVPRRAEGMIDWTEADKRLTDQDDQDKTEFGGGMEPQATDELNEAQTVVETLINEIGTATASLFSPILEPMKGTITSFRSLMKIGSDDMVRTATSRFLKGVDGLQHAIVELRGTVYSSPEVPESDLPFYDDGEICLKLANIGQAVRNLLKDSNTEELRWKRPTLGCDLLLVVDCLGEMIQLLSLPEEVMTSYSRSMLSSQCNDLLPSRSSPPRIERIHRIQKNGKKAKREGKIEKRRKGKEGKKGEK